MDIRPRRDRFGALAAVVRGLRGDANMGNFYLDLWRAVAYVLVAIILVAGALLFLPGAVLTSAAEQFGPFPFGG